MRQKDNDLGRGVVKCAMTGYLFVYFCLFSLLSRTRCDLISGWAMLASEITDNEKWSFAIFRLTQFLPRWKKKIIIILQSHISKFRFSLKKDEETPWSFIRGARSVRLYFVYSSSVKKAFLWMNSSWTQISLTDCLSSGHFESNLKEQCASLYRKPGSSKDG